MDTLYRLLRPHYTDYYGQSSADFQGLADAILLVEKQQLPVHKAILAANSATFAKMFESCSVTTEPCTVVPLDDSIHDVCTTLKFLYEGCSALDASTLTSVEDAYCVANMAHKYDMQALLEECETYLVQRAANPSKLFDQPGATVRWTLLAEKCELSLFLAHCEIFMTGKTDDNYWTDPMENAMHLSSDCLLRMLKLTTWKKKHYGRCPDLTQIIQWQRGNNSNLQQ